MIRILSLFSFLFVFVSFPSRVLAAKDPVKENILIDLPVFLNLPENPESPIKRELYAYDKESKSWLGYSVIFSSIKEIEKLEIFGFDPVRFTVTSNKDSVKIGKEVELTITAEYLDVNGMLMFQFEGANSFTLKMLTPKGFIVTGGTYTDFIQGQVDRNTPLKKYTIKGFFESESIDCFQLLRAGRNADQNSFYVKKVDKCVKTEKAIAIIIKKVTTKPEILKYEENSVANVTSFCSDLRIGITINAFLENNAFDRNAIKVYPTAARYFAGGLKARTVKSIIGGKIKLYRKLNGIEYFVGDILPSNFNESQLIFNVPGGPLKNGTDENFYIKNTANEINKFNGTFERNLIGDLDVDCDVTDISYDKSRLNFSSGTFSFKNENTYCNEVYKLKCEEYYGFYFVKLGKIAYGPYAINYNLEINKSNFNQNGIIEYYRYLNADPTIRDITIAALNRVGDINIITSKSELCNGEKAKLSVNNASNCTSGDINWFKNNILNLIGSGNSIEVTGSGTYFAACKGTCNITISNTVNIQLKNDPPPAPNITAPTTSLCAQSTITLNVANASTGDDIAWSPSNGIKGKTFDVSTAGTYTATITTACGTSSSSITIGSTTPPAPTIESGDTQVCAGKTTTLLAKNCGGIVKWTSTSLTGETINVGPGSYSARCETTSCGNSPYSSIVIIGTRPAIDCANCVAFDLKLLATSKEIQAGTEVEISPDLSDAKSSQCYTNNAVFYEDGIGIEKNLLVKPVVSTTYKASCTLNGCTSTVATITITVLDPKPPVFQCGDLNIFAGSNASNDPGSVSQGDLLNFWGGVNNGQPGAVYAYQWYKNEVEIPGANNASYNINPASPANNGSYKLRVLKWLDTNACFSNSFDVEVASCRLDATLNYSLPAANSNNDVYLYVQTNIDCSQCTYMYSGPNFTNLIAGPYYPITTAGNNRGNYTLTVLAPGGCVSTSSVDVQFYATPQYDGRVNNLYCDNISGWVADMANPSYNQEVRLIVKSLAGVDVAHNIEIIPENVNGRWYYDVPFPDEFKNGITYNMAIQHINENNRSLPYRDVYKSISCCKLELSNLQVSCNSDNKTGLLQFSYQKRSLINGQLRPLTFRILARGADRYGDPSYNPIGDWETINQNSTSNTFLVDSLIRGYYKLEIKEGDGPNNNSCIKSELFEVTCQPIVDANCVLPYIIVNPSDTLKEGINLNAELVANFSNANLNQVTAGFDKVLYFDGNSIFKTNDVIGSGFENITTEAWVNIPQNNTITVGYMGEGEKQNVLFNSSDLTTSLWWWLSVGSNGVSLYEKDNTMNFKNQRIALSYEIALSGWNHIAVVYDNNLPSIYINGELVAKAKQKGKDYFGTTNYQVRPASTVGANTGGFVGYVDELKMWSNPQTATQIKASMLHRSNAAIVTNPNLKGYFVFNSAQGLHNMVMPTSPSADLNGAVLVNSTSSPALANMPANQNLKWIYNSTIVAENSFKYQIPLKNLKIGTYTYVLSFNGKNGQTCEAKKEVIVTAPPINELSGCYYINSISEVTNPTNASDYYLGTISSFENIPTVSKKNGLDDIWQVDHLGNQEYILRSTYLMGNNLASNNGINLKSNTIFDQSHVWKLLSEGNIAEMKYSIRPLNENNKSLGFYSSPPSTLIKLDYANANNQIFKLERTGCPQPPLECAVDSKINYERWFTGLNNVDINFFQGLNVKDYINQNPLADFSQTMTMSNLSITHDTDAPGVFQNKPSNWRNGKFVSRITGYFCPPTTGKYNFAIRTNEWAELYISTDENPKNISKKVTLTTNYDNFENDNTAYNIPMVKGRNVYFEIIAKDFDTYHRLAVAIKPSGGYFNTTDQPTSLSNIASFPRDFKKRRKRSQSEECSQPQVSFVGVKPLINLWARDTVFAGDFNVDIEYVRGSNGVFSGYGVTNFKNKLLKDTRLIVKFDGIAVNDEYELTAGFFETTYDKTKSGIKDVSDEFKKFKSFIEVVDSVAKETFANLGNRKKLDHLVKSIKEMAEQDLPEDLQIEAFEIADRLKNATTAAQFNQAKADLAALKAKKDAFLDWYALVMKAALLKIKNQAACTAPPAQTGVGVLAASDNWQPMGNKEEVTDPAIIAKFNAELLYNACVLSKSFANVYLNASISNAKLSELAKELTKGSSSLIEELYTIYKASAPAQPPYTNTSPAVIKSGDFLMSNIFKILSEKVYNETK